MRAAWDGRSIRWPDVPGRVAHQWAATAWAGIGIVATATNGRSGICRSMSPTENFGNPKPILANQNNVLY
jgi:hypothetical protein